VQLPLFENLIWAFGAGLKGLLCFLAFYRRLYRRLSWFTLYLALLPCKSAVVWWAYHQWGYTSRPAWYIYWSASAIVLIVRGLVIAELCSKILKPYPGLWSLMRRLLILAALALFVWAGLAAARETSWIVAHVRTAERGLEFAASFLLVLLLAITIRYRIGLETLERNVLLGLALYSTFEMLNSTLMARRLVTYFTWWELVRIGCFDVAMALWLIPLLKPLPAPAPATPLLDEPAAAGLLRQLLGKMQELRNELIRIGKVFRK